jgi:hypothetical protein
MTKTMYVVDSSSARIRDIEDGSSVEDPYITGPDPALDPTPFFSERSFLIEFQKNIF